jgi:hypothetical protein
VEPVQEVANPYDPTPFRAHANDPLVKQMFANKRPFELALSNLLGAGMHLDRSMNADKPELSNSGTGPRTLHLRHRTPESLLHG